MVHCVVIDCVRLQLHSRLRLLSLCHKVEILYHWIWRYLRKNVPRNARTYILAVFDILNLALLCMV